MHGKKHIKNIDRSVFSLLRITEHIFGSRFSENSLLRKGLNRLHKLNHQQVLKSLEQKGTGVRLDIPRVYDLEPNEFIKNYASKAMPVIFPGAAKGWKCCKKWTPSFFSENYGNDRVILIDDHIATNESVLNETTISEVVASFGTDSPKYARFVPILANNPTLLDDFDRNWLGALIDGNGQLRLWGENGTGAGIRSHLFIGKGQSKTEMHCAITNNLFVNVYGKKRWLIYPPTYNPAFNSPVNRAPGIFGSAVDPLNPDSKDFPMFEYIDRYEVELEPGDILYNPPFYWHHVTNLTDTVSIGLRWYDFKYATIASIMQHFLSFIATNPSMLFAIKNAVEYGETHGEKKKKFSLKDFDPEVLTS
jgi:hypothetical protein